MAEKGVHIIGVVQVEGEREMEIRIAVRLGNLRDTYTTTVYLDLV
jgi:hypothetical protein